MRNGIRHSHLPHLRAPNGVQATDHRPEEQSPRRRAPYRPRRGADADLHARGHAGRREGRTHARAARRCEGLDHAQQHLSPLPAARHGGDRARGRAAQIQWLGRADPHRQRRLPSAFAQRHPEDHRGRREVQQPHRWQQAPVHAGKRDGHPAHHRRGHHDGF